MQVTRKCLKTKKKKQINEGKFQLMFISPEALFSETVWKHILSTELYWVNLVDLIVDEAHCVNKW